MLGTAIRRTYLSQLKLTGFRSYPRIYLAQNGDFSVLRSYAKAAFTGIQGLGKKKLGGKTGPALEKKVLPVETDPEKLINYCCGTNLNKEGEPIKLKDDSEYPDWLWTLYTGPGANPPLEMLDPDTEEYWERVQQVARKRKTSLQKLKKF